MILSHLTREQLRQRLYQITNEIRQEGHLMSDSNFNKLNNEQNEIRIKLIQGEN